MRPHINGDYRIKFKAEALPLKDGLGGMRMLYSHNAEFHLNAAIFNDRMSMERIAQALPALQTIPWEKNEQAELVGGTIVEEVLQDIGELDFGNRMAAMCERRAVAQPRRPLAADRRIRLPAEVPPPRGTDRRCAGPLRGVLPGPAGRGARLDPARRHQDRRGLSAEGQPAQRPRMTASSVAGRRCPEGLPRRNHGQVLTQRRQGREERHEPAQEGHAEERQRRQGRHGQEPKQAIAIGLSEARKKGKKVPKAPGPPSHQANLILTGVGDGHRPAWWRRRHSCRRHR